MTKLKFLLPLFGLLLFLSGCSFYNNQVSDLTFLSPPEEDDTVSGIWSAQEDLLATEYYIYGNGNFVTVFQDVEEETWVCDGHWSEDGDYSFEPIHFYNFDQESGKWIESTDTFGSATGKLNNNKLELNVSLPNQQNKEISLDKNSLNIDIPQAEEIALLINNFLEL